MSGGTTCPNSGYAARCPPVKMHSELDQRFESFSDFLFLLKPIFIYLTLANHLRLYGPPAESLLYSCILIK
ncbi:uncharacterized protein VTP21DRAFT_391 [Calcarisporiella thermophila]|uniref:uncharacterized protein n=1 Tax=Calcarisporiella thermophila TaxID=911321 RepID=UPI003743AB22